LKDIEDAMGFFNHLAGRGAGTKGLLVYYCLVLLSLLTHVALAQQPVTRLEATGLDKPAQDIVVSGTVDQLSNSRTLPAGFLLNMNGPQGTLTASLGSRLSLEVQQSLTAGATVQVTGTMETIGGKTFLLARTITAGGQQTTLRNQHGFAVYPLATNKNLSGGAK
jgi:hypothetical protein